MKLTQLLFLIMLKLMVFDGFNHVDRGNAVEALLCYVCNSGNPGEEKCGNSTDHDWKSVAQKFSQNCSTFQDFLAVMNRISAQPSTSPTSSAIIAFPDWTLIQNDPKFANYQGVCKMIRTDSRTGIKPWFTGNKTKTWKMPTRCVRYCSWEERENTINLDSCKKPSVSRRFDVTTCTCHDKDHCNLARNLNGGHKFFILCVATAIVSLAY